MTPLSPTIVSKPSGNIVLLFTNSYALANFIELTISYSVYYSTPYVMFSLKLPENKVGSYATNPIDWCNFYKSYFFISIPSNNI